MGLITVERLFSHHHYSYPYLCTDLVREAGSGLLLDPIWETADGCLAKVIILDQFTRCIFRGTPLAFQHDQVASALVNHIINSGWMDFFSSIERFFLGVAIQHSENLALQQVGVNIARNVAAGAPAEVVEYFANIKGYPMEHYEVIERFGRFPSRNLALVSFESLIVSLHRRGLFTLCFVFTEGSGEHCRRDRVDVFTGMPVVG